MKTLDIIEFYDDSGDIMVIKIPQDGSGEFTLGTQLVVQESQTAIFFRDGCALDSFEPGRHTLSTQNLPLLGKIIELPFGAKSPFRCHIFFVAKKTFVNLGWGTQSPVLFRDADFKMISLRAYGAFSIRIVNVRTFLNTLVGTRGMETSYHLEEFLKSVIVSRLTESLGTIMQAILDLPKNYNTIALKTKEAVALDFDQYGIELVDLVVQAITPPSEVQEMLNKASGIAAQDTEKYKAVAFADSMKAAAEAPGGFAADGIGAGIGMAMGFGMAQQISHGLMAQQPAASTPAKPSMTYIKEKLMELKSLKDEGIIDDADFDEQKRRLLSQL